MDFQETQSWTLVGLVRAFLQLALVYFLLCASTFAFFTSKFLRFFGLFLPCPCEGFLGFRNSNLCFYELLLNWPARRISYVRRLALERFPFDLLLLKNHSCNSPNEDLIRQRTLEYEVQKLEDEASCSSYSATRSRYLVDRENGHDAKGKRVLNWKRRSGIRRRRKVTHEGGDISSAFISSSPSPTVGTTHVSCLQKGEGEHRCNATESLYCASGDLYLQRCQQDDKVAATGNDVDEKSCHSYEFNVSLVDHKELENYTSSLEIYANNVQDKMEMVGNEVDRIKMLEQALEEEKAARIALYLELEKERAAAATAADESMAMMFRLQEEKASIEMELRQYQRVIEERFAYDEEEMDILKEILIRREKENHLLEREIETYRQMSSGGNDQLAGEINGMEGDPSSFDVQEDFLLDLPEADCTPYIAGKSESGSSNESPSFTAVPTCVAATLCSSGDGQEREKDLEQTGQLEDGLHGNMIDSEQIVFDVHVIDDNIDLRKDLDCNSAADGPGCCRGESQIARKKEKEHNLDRIMNAKLSTSREQKGDTLVYDSKGDSLSADNSEKLKVDTEIEMLGKKLQMLQCGKEKLTVLTDKGGNQYDQFKLLEEIAYKLQELKQLRDSGGWVLPTSSSKVKLQKGRCQSVPLNRWDSA